MLFNAPGSNQDNARVIGGRAYPDPFVTYATLIMPRTIEDILRWAEHLTHRNGSYAQALRRVVSYFLTKVEITNASEDEKDKYRKFLEKRLKVMTQLYSLGNDFMCFSGDTKAITDSGVFKLRDLAGKTVNVLSVGGVYRPAEFKSFGRQELLEVEFSDGRTVLATPEHQWVVSKSTGGTKQVPTTELAGRRIPRVVASRPEKNADFAEGVRHGFVFGDGSTYNYGRQGVANFCGAKVDMLPYFEGCSQPCEYPEISQTKIHGLPASYKLLPANEASASYWYGFVCGFLAADGSVDTYGCVILTQKSEATLKAIAEQLPRIGMVAGPVRTHWQESTFVRSNGRVEHYDGDMSYVTLLKQCMQPDDLLRPHHRKQFEENFKDTSYGELIGVRNVRETGIVDEVFCCVEPETHTFVLENGVLTGNCYGNSFSSLYIPFRRFLRCSKCRVEQPIEKVDYRFSSFKFGWKCQRCNTQQQSEKPIDRPSLEEDKVTVIRWSPHQIKIRHHLISQQNVYLWDPPATFKRQIIDGDPFIVNKTHWEVIEAIKHNKLFEFEPRVIYHMKEESLAGVYANGWGIPRMMTNFTQAFHVQMLKLYNEVLAQEYIVPFRVLTPAPGSGQAPDPMVSTNLGNFQGRVSAMFRQFRRQPGGWHFLPFPVNYQALGGEGMQMTTHELIDQAMDEMLNAAGVPAEFYKGTLGIQETPIALRLFQQTWPHFVAACNGWLNWAMETLATTFNWEAAEANLQPVTLADDLENKQILLQLAAGNQISKSVAFAPLGIDPAEDRKRILDEKRTEDEQNQKYQQEQQQKQMLQQQLQSSSMQSAGAAPGGAGGAGGGEDASVTPGDKMAQAEQIAQQLLQMQDSERRSELLRIKKSDEALWSLVKAKLQTIRQDAASQGQKMVLQGQGQQAGPPQQA